MVAMYCSSRVPIGETRSKASWHILSNDSNQPNRHNGGSVGERSLRLTRSGSSGGREGVGIGAFLLVERGDLNEARRV